MVTVWKSGVGATPATFVDTGVPHAASHGDGGLDDMSGVYLFDSTPQAAGRPSGAVAETFSRVGATIANSANLTSGTLRLVAIPLPANQAISSITFVSGSTALDTGENQWFALFNSSRVMLAVTADDTTAAWAATTAKTLNIANIASGASATYTTTAAGLYYLGIMVKASGAVPSLISVVSSSAATGIAPILAGNSSGSQTTPQTFPFTAAALTASGIMPWAYVS